MSKASERNEDTSTETSQTAAESGPVADLLLALVLAAVGTGVAIQGFRLGMSVVDLNSAGLAPTVFGSILALSGFALALQVARACPRASKAGSRDRGARGLPPYLRGPAFGLALLVAYTALLEPLGYVIATFAFAAATLHLLGWRGIRGLISAVGLTALVYGVFSVLLNAPLPSGLLG